MIAPNDEIELNIEYVIDDEDWNTSTDSIDDLDDEVDWDQYYSRRIGGYN